MKIIWSKQDFGKKELMRYGLVTKNSEHDIESIFEEHGCFSKKFLSPIKFLNKIYYYPKWAIQLTFFIV